MNINLYGPNGEHTLKLGDPNTLPPKSEPKKKNTDPAATRHRKASFACMRKLKPLLAKHNVSDEDVWRYIKEFYKVKSRTELSAQEWAVISAKLNAAYRNNKILIGIVNAVQ